MIDSPKITPAEFAQFQRLIYKVAGISLADSKQVMVAGRLTNRLRHFGYETFSQYYKRVVAEDGEEELQTMVDLLTTNETYFFREPQHFAFLADRIAADHAEARPLDVWSAASSTGEEVYTIAMVLADVLGVDGAWTVTGSDISRRVLETARRGVYWLERTRGLSKDYLRKYCLKGVRSQEGTFIIAPELRQHTRFTTVNLNSSLPNIGPFDVIFLRNVMIYFDTETKRQVVERVVRRLRPEGYLIIGHSESLHGITECVETVQPTIYRLKPPEPAAFQPRRRAGGQATP